MSPEAIDIDTERLRGHLDSILESTEDGIFVLNEREEVVVFNHACERLTGLVRSDVLGGRLTCDEIFRCHRFTERHAPPPGRLPVLPQGGAGRGGEGLACALFDIFREHKDKAREEILLVSRSGERHWVETSFSPVHDEPAGFRYTVGVLRIIDDRKRAEHEVQKKNQELEGALAELRERTRQLIHAEKMASIGQLAAGLAHELNTPLGTILGYAQLVLKQLSEAEQECSASDRGSGPSRAASGSPGGLGLPGTERSRSLLGLTDPALQGEVRAIEGATKRCRDIVQGLLDFSRRSDGFRAPRPLNKVIERACSLLKHDLERRGVACSLELDPAAGPVLADENQLEQVFLNLASNALDAMPGGGRITVRTAPRGGQVLVEVADTGVGIPPEALPRIFEPFFTTKGPGKGTGLGLSIVEKIVDEHGGSIEVASELGKGTTFRLLLPVVA